MVVENLFEFDLKLYRVVEKLEFVEYNFYTPHQYIDFTYEVEENDVRRYLTVHTEVADDEVSIIEMSCEFDIADCFSGPLQQKMKFEWEWKGVNQFFKDYLRSWETLESENISTPVVYEYVLGMDCCMERFEKNQILLFTTFEQSGLEVGGELFKLKEIFQNQSNKVKPLPSDVEPTFIDESDMMVSFLKEQIRNGTFEEWVGKQ
jgi:hypothetical protein